MEDRIPKYPGRVTLTPVPGQPNKYDMVRADEPTQEGMPICKATLLSDETAALHGKDGNAVPNDIFADLAEPVGTVKYTVRTDLDDRWLLCNGARIPEGIYPQLEGITKISMLDRNTQSSYFNAIWYIGETNTWFTWSVDNQGLNLLYTKDIEGAWSTLLLKTYGSGLGVYSIVYDTTTKNYYALISGNRQAEIMRIPQGLNTPTVVTQYSNVATPGKLAVYMGILVWVYGYNTSPSDESRQPRETHCNIATDTSWSNSVTLFTPPQQYEYVGGFTPYMRTVNGILSLYMSLQSVYGSTYTKYALLYRFSSNTFTQMQKVVTVDSAGGSGAFFDGNNFIISINVGSQIRTFRSTSFDTLLSAVPTSTGAHAGSVLYTILDKNNQYYMHYVLPTNVYTMDVFGYNSTTLVQRISLSGVTGTGNELLLDEFGSVVLPYHTNPVLFHTFCRRVPTIPLEGAYAYIKGRLNHV